MRWLEGCLTGLAGQVYKDYKIIVVDDASTDGSKEFILKYYPQIVVLSNQEQRGFAATVNKGIRSATTEYIVLLNTDTIPSPGWLQSLINEADKSPLTVGSFASKMLQMEKTELIDDAGDLLMSDGCAIKRGHGRPASEFDKKCEVFSACAGAALYRYEFLKKTGGFDEAFESYLEDVDIGLRGHLLGYSCLFVPSAKVLHYGHGSGIPTGRYVQLVTKNRLMLILKNFPIHILIRNFFTILRGLGCHFVACRKPAASIHGYLSFIALIPHVLKERKFLQARRVINDYTILNLFTSHKIPGDEQEGKGRSDEDSLY
jgi:GT2 family glycosyltransferase